VNDKGRYRQERHGDLQDTTASRKIPVFAQAVRESAPNFIPLKQGTWVVDVNVLYHSLPELAS
jgi:hypothetical protein